MEMWEQIMDKSKNVIIVILLAGLVGSLVYFSSKMDALNEKVNQALSQPPPAAPQSGGRAGRDPYLTGAVKNTIRKRAGDIQKIYLEYLEGNPEKTDGKIEVDWQIEPDGSVISGEVIFSEFGNKEMEQNIIKAIAKWKFPPPPGGRNRYVAHKFLLKKEE